MLTINKLSIVNLRRKSSTATDPIQQLFVEKLREYFKKKAESGGKMFDPIAELEKEREEKYLILIKSFFKASAPSDPTQFPSFEFTEKPLDSINLNLDEKPKK